MTPEVPAILLQVAFIILLICIAVSCCKNRNDRNQAQRVYYTLLSEAAPENYRASGATVRLRTKSVYHNLVQMLVDRFEGQRIKGYQFAVLFLSPEADVSDTGRVKIWAKTGAEDTNSTYSTHPLDNYFGNFIVARPNGQQHAEKLLMGKFDKLWSKNQDCKTIVLYTWLLPCNSCADKIAKVLGSREEEVIVLYTSIVKDMQNEDYTCSKDKLRKAGIKVEQVNCNKKLLPKE